MSVTVPRAMRFVLCLLVVGLLVPLAPASAFAYGGESHKHAAWEGTALFTPFMRDEVSPDEPLIARRPTYPLFPALESESTFWEYGWEEGVDDNGNDVAIVPSSNRYWVYWGSKREDDYDSEYSYAEVYEKTVAHFWDLDHGVLHQPGSAYYNAWMKAEEMWVHSMDEWRAGNDGKAYFYLGKAIHLLTDQGQPAHPHADLHWPDDDSLEEWSGEDDAKKFSWYRPDTLYPGPVIWAPAASDVLDDINACPDIWQDDMTSFTHDDCPNGAFYDELTNLNGGHRVQELFYLMSYVNQTADFCASDDFPGDDLDYLHWVDFSQLDPALKDYDLSDNDAGCDLDDGRDHSTCKSDQCNADGQLWAIYSTAYSTAFRAVPGAINAWRRTLDSDPPSSTVELTRTDGKPMAQWNNSPVTAHITGAEDEDSPGRESGVWKVWGELDGVAPANEADPSWGVSTDGIHSLACMSTDYFGNVERHDLEIAIDTTPPDISFPDLRHNYLTSQDFLASWEATDALSGVDSSVAYLDGELVDNGDLVDLALEAGRHTLEVYAYDVAGNMAYATYDFEVWIDATATSKPIKLNDKTGGNAMYVDVQFPAPYDVGALDLATQRLSVLGHIDLSLTPPIAGATAVLPGTNLSGVGDHNNDGIPDRGVRFEKSAFAAALGGQTGEIDSVVWGSLAIEGSPRYIASVTTNVFCAPK